MDAKQIKEAIGRCRSQVALREIVEACRARQDELRKAKWRRMQFSTRYGVQES